MTTILLVLTFLSLTTLSCSQTVELTWDVYNQVQVGTTSRLLHFTTNPTQQFYVDYETNNDCVDLIIVLKYSCGVGNQYCNPYPSCTDDPVTCNFDYALNGTSNYFPYATSTLDPNARDSCSCIVNARIPVEQNWYALVENYGPTICNLTIRVHDKLEQFPLYIDQEFVLEGNSVLQAYTDVPKDYPLQFFFNQNFCDSPVYFRYRYTCTSDYNPYCNQFLKYPETSYCLSSSDCNYPNGNCFSGICYCATPFSGPECSYYTSAPRYTTVYANYRSQPFDPQNTFYQPDLRTNCGCSAYNKTGMERWYFTFINPNATTCNITFTPRSMVEGFFPNTVSQASYDGFTQPYQARYFRFGLGTQKLSLSLATYSSNCVMTAATHQVCGDAGDCYTAPYGYVANYDSSTTLTGYTNGMINTTFLLSNTGVPISSCGCSSTSQTSDVWLSLISTSSTICSYSLQARVTDICASGGTYDRATGTCICPAGTFGDNCQTTPDTCGPVSSTGVYDSDTCISLNSSSCLCPIGFGSGYRLPTLTFPETVFVDKGYFEISTPVEGSDYPAFDVFSILSYKFYNAKNNKETTIRFGNFDAPFPFIIQIVMLRQKEPDVILVVDKGTGTNGYSTYTNTLQFYDPEIITYNLTGNGTVTFTNLEPEVDYFFKVAAVGYYTSDTSTYTKFTYKAAAFAFTMSVEPNDSYAKVVNILLLLALIIIFILPCIVVPLYRKKLHNKSFLPDTSSIVAKEEQTSLLTKIVLILLSFALYLGFRLLRAVFNLSILFFSFGRFVEFPDISRLWELFPENMKDVLSDWSTFIGNLGNFITKFVFLQDRYCTGAISVTYLISIIIAFYFLFITLRMNLLIIIVMGTRRFFHGKHKILTSLYGSLAEAVGNAFFYLIQFAVFTIYNVLDGLFKLKGGCSDFDKEFNDKFKVFGYIVIAPLTILCLFAFMPQKLERMSTYGNKISGIIKWVLATLFAGAFCIVTVSLGVWNDFTVKSYEIKERANKYDDDPTDKDSRQETVIGMTGKAVSLIWLLIPGLAVVTKFTEVVSENIIFDDTRAGLDLITPKKERIRKFILSATVLALQIGTVWTLSIKALSAVFGIVFVQALEKLLTDLYKLTKSRSAI